LIKKKTAKPAHIGKISPRGEKPHHGEIAPKGRPLFVQAISKNKQAKKETKEESARMRKRKPKQKGRANEGAQQDLKKERKRGLDEHHGEATEHEKGRKKKLVKAPGSGGSSRKKARMPETGKKGEADKRQIT